MYSSTPYAKKASSSSLYSSDSSSCISFEQSNSTSGEILQVESMNESSLFTMDPTADTRYDIPTSPVTGNEQVLPRLSSHSIITTSCSNMPLQSTSPSSPHLDEGPVPRCQWGGCNEQFQSLNQLVSHLEHAHTASLHEYVCQWENCPRKKKSFDARYKLVTHLRCHTGERPFKCSHLSCNRKFSRLENLKLHMRTHTGEKPYVCHHVGCDKKFNNTSDRAKHMKTHITKKPYVCRYEGCDKAYTDPSSMRKHIKLVHKQANKTTLNSPTGSNSIAVLTPVNDSYINEQTHEVSPSSVPLEEPSSFDNVTNLHITTEDDNTYNTTISTNNITMETTALHPSSLIQPVIMIRPPMTTTILSNRLFQPLFSSHGSFPAIGQPTLAAGNNQLLLPSAPLSLLPNASTGPLVYQQIMFTRPVQQVILPVIPVTTTITPPNTC